MAAHDKDFDTVFARYIECARSGVVTHKQGYLRIGAKFKKLHQGAGIGAGTGSKYGNAFHGAKVAESSRRLMRVHSHRKPITFRNASQKIGNFPKQQHIRFCMPETQDYPTIPYTREAVSDEAMTAQAAAFYAWMDGRRTVREFLPDPIPEAVIHSILLAASTAPSGAHKQPWSFCVVTNPELKKRIREAAEQEEQESYNGRMPQDWLDDLAPLGTDWRKPFLEVAPVLIVVFRRIYEEESGRKKNNYYVNESVGLACGFLLAAIHQAGLGALTHTPSPMNFLSELLERPANERPFLLIPVGKVPENCHVPDLQRKTLDQVCFRYD